MLNIDQGIIGKLLHSSISNHQTLETFDICNIIPQDVSLLYMEKRITIGLDNIVNGNIGYIRTYDLLTPSNETWGVDNAFGPSSKSAGNGHLDMTYSGTGEKLVVWLDAYNLLNSNHGAIDISVTGYPRICTNLLNFQDPFVCWDKEYDLDGDSSEDQAVFVKEIHP